MLIFVFVVNGIITIATLNSSKKLSNHISTVIDPSQQVLQDLKMIFVESKLYATNWVFLRSNQDDKNALIKLHVSGYPLVKKKLGALINQLDDPNISDSLNRIFKDFEGLLETETGIMNTLTTFKDYDDPIKKMESERIIEDEVIPKTAQLTNALNSVASHEHAIKIREYNNLEQYSIRLRIFISILAVSIVCIGILLSIYLTKRITTPISRIKKIIKDLGRGVINKVDYKESNDEIGKMIRSVNTLAEKLEETAAFAQNIGNRNFNVNYAPLSKDDILGKALIAMRDNLKTSEEVLLATNEDLKKTNSELDKFVYSVSHDLRAPLSSMLGVLGFLESETEDAQMLKDIGLLKTSVNKLDCFILDIIDYSRNARLEIVPEKIDFAALLEDTVHHIKFMAAGNKRVEIKTDINTVQDFHSDKGRISIILNNIISNSIRYSNPDNPEPFVEIKILTTTTDAEIIISDNGVGINEEHLPKVFDMFYRVSKKSVGSGLGLYIVKETVEKLKGTIKIESIQGKGTTFKISLPNC